jgi:hypothetical protein
LDERRVLLIVGGGIAAYKAADLLRKLTEAGHEVRVVPTAAALRFVGAPTWAALSGQPVADEVWSDVHEVPHVALGRHADLCARVLRPGRRVAVDGVLRSRRSGSDPHARSPGLAVVVTSLQGLLPSRAERIAAQQGLPRQRRAPRIEEGAMAS